MTYQLRLRHIKPAELIQWRQSKLIVTVMSTLVYLEYSQSVSWSLRIMVIVPHVAAAPSLLNIGLNVIKLMVTATDRGTADHVMLRDCLKNTVENCLSLSVGWSVSRSSVLQVSQGRIDQLGLDYIRMHLFPTDCWSVCKSINSASVSDIQYFSFSFQNAGKNSLLC